MNPLEEQIRREIETSGPITFARFMELALYEPELGYYERQEQIGRGGDFYTSVSVGSLFGQFLALQFSEWMGALLSANPGTTVQIVEAGAHTGQLAADIVRWLSTHRSGLYQDLEYFIVEPSIVHQAWQRQTLHDFLERVRWVRSLDELAGKTRGKGGSDGNFGVKGVIFSNELLDAMPVHRLRWNGSRRTWGEWKVGLSRAGFVWEVLPIASGLEPFLPEVPPALGEWLPDGFTIEVSPAALEWWREAAGVLSAGKLLTIDYGFEAEDFLEPERSRGTVRTYSSHHVGDDLLSGPGAQDITAHVNFSALQLAGEKVGLTTEAYLSQSRFLTQVFEKAIQEKNAFGNPLDWIRQFQTLTHPEHLGRPFKVLVQAREVGSS